MLYHFSTSPVQDAPFFKENEKEQLCRRYGLSSEELKQALDGSAYIFEQAAFSSIAPEPLIQALEEAGYNEAQAKVRVKNDPLIPWSQLLVYRSFIPQ